MRSCDPSSTPRIVCRVVLFTDARFALFLISPRLIDSLSFLLLHLARCPDVEAAMRDEIAAVCGQFDLVPDGRSVRRLRYCLQVWHETLRLHPVAAGGLWRTAEEHTVLPSGVVVHRGTDILVPISAVHMNVGVYGDDVSDFKPERFDPGASRTRLKDFGSSSFLPFSAGRKNCFGQVLATHEVLMVLAALLSRYKVSLACDPNDIVEVFNLTLKPEMRSGNLYAGLGLPVFLKRLPRT